MEVYNLHKDYHTKPVIEHKKGFKNNLHKDYTMESGSFSIFNVHHMSSKMMHYQDMDGVILSSRHLEAFKVAPLGEDRVKNNVTVMEKRSYVAKNWTRKPTTTPTLGQQREKGHQGVTPIF